MLSLESSDQVDIIVCEWMGYFLLYENFLKDVILARDKYLKPGGMILPNRVRMQVAGLMDRREIKLEKQCFWKSVYDIDMSVLGKNSLVEPLVDRVESNDICTTTCEYYKLDIQTCSIDQIKYAQTYKLKMLKDARLDGLVCWFDTDFSSN